MISDSVKRVILNFTALLFFIFTVVPLFLYLSSAYKYSFSESKVIHSDSFSRLYWLMNYRQIKWDQFQEIDFLTKAELLWIDKGERDLARKILKLDRDIENKKSELNILREDEILNLLRAQEVLKEDRVGYIDICLVELIGVDGAKGGQAIKQEAYGKYNIYKERKELISKRARKFIQQYEACLLEKRGRDILMSIDLDKVYLNDRGYIKKIGGEEFILQTSREAYEKLKKSFELGNRRKELMEAFCRLPYYLEITKDISDEEEDWPYSWYFKKNKRTGFYPCIGEEVFKAQYIKHRSPHRKFVFLNKTEKTEVLHKATFRYTPNPGERISLFMDYYYEKNYVGKTRIPINDQGSTYYIYRDEYRYYKGLNIERKN